MFKQALLRRGIPQRLYVDNGANYRSQHLALVCAKLGIALIHARPYQPQGKGKQERWFRTVRAQFLSRLSAADTDSLAVIVRGAKKHYRMGGEVVKALDGVDLDIRRRGEVYAIGINKKKDAVCRKVTRDHRSIGACHS